MEPREVRFYTVPVIGKVKDWKSFSGDPADPIRPTGLKQYGKIHDFSGVDPDDRWRRISLVSVDPDSGTCEVRVHASVAFLDGFEAWRGNRSNAALAQVLGMTQLKRGNNPRPEVSLKYNEGIF